MKKQRVLNGIDRIDSVFNEISGAKIGLITNPTGVDRNLCPTIDILHRKGLLYCLFSPEHGIRGNALAGAPLDNGLDEGTGVNVYSLYGKTVHIPDEAMESIDIVAFDIQDVGARFYTYTSTLAYAMEDCAKAGKRMLVFDRVNPIGGSVCEGTVLDSRFSSFVGRYAVATRHAMTVGEYAKFINETENINCNLTVVELDGWERKLYFDDTDLVWRNPSPNMPNPETALCYIGTCLAEGTNISEGRGTTMPFRLVGAPWLNSKSVCEEINRQTQGVIFKPCSFTPSTSKYAGVGCNGIMLNITDRDAFKPFEASLRLLEHIRRTHKEFKFLPPQSDNPFFIDLLLGSDEWRSESFSIDEFLKTQNKKCDNFFKTAKKFFMY